MTSSFNKIGNDASVCRAKHSPRDVGLVRKCKCHLKPSPTILSSALKSAGTFDAFSSLLEGCLLVSNHRVLTY